MKQRNWQCDITPAVEELGFSPEYDLERGVKETIAWYKDCLLYTSDAADDLLCVDLCGRRIY